MKSGISPDSELLELIGTDGLFALAERFGGIRLYIPSDIAPDHPIAQAVGVDKAKAMADRLAPDYIKVPLAREVRAVTYHGTGWSNAQIALHLGITETGVEKLFKRLFPKGGCRG